MTVDRRPCHSTSTLEPSNTRPSTLQPRYLFPHIGYLGHQFPTLEISRPGICDQWQEKAIELGHVPCMSFFCCAYTALATDPVPRQATITDRKTTETKGRTRTTAINAAVADDGVVVSLFQSQHAARTIRSATSNSRPGDAWVEGHLNESGVYRNYLQNKSPFAYEKASGSEDC